jgi:DNA excision repair protein ERCC-4
MTTQTQITERGGGWSLAADVVGPIVAKLTGSPAKFGPTILIDTREQCPLVFLPEIQTEVIGLPAGDYGLKNFSDWSNPAFIIERKSLGDLAGSLGQDRARFMREVEKLRQFGFRALVIEADRAAVELHAYRSQMAPTAILGTLDALSVRAGLHVFWCGTPDAAARQVESLARQFARGIVKQHAALMAGAGKAEPPT